MEAAIARRRCSGYSLFAIYFVFSCLDGKTGWYQTGGTTHRDTDWYSWQDVPSGRVTFTLDAELPTQLMWLSMPGDCSTLQVLESVVAGPCSPASIQVDVEPHSPIMPDVDRTDHVRAPRRPDQLRVRLAT